MYLSKSELENKKKHLTNENKEKILSYKDIHKGERCFIIGASPSLAQLDLTKLNDEYTFCVNRGYKLKEKGLKHSTYYAFADKDLVENDRVMDYFPDEFCNKFFVYAGLNFPDDKYNTVYFTKSIMKNKIFTDNLTQDLTEGYSIIHHAIQIAYYMGFQEMYLAGVDLDFLNVKGHIYKEFNSEIQRQINMSVKSQSVMRKYIAYASDYIWQHGKMIYNVSPLNTIDFMPKIKYEELFK